jgi:hypothetical protein
MPALEEATFKFRRLDSPRLFWSTGPPIILVVVVDLGTVTQYIELVSRAIYGPLNSSHGIGYFE